MSLMAPIKVDINLNYYELFEYFAKNKKKNLLLAKYSSGNFAKNKYFIIFVAKYEYYDKDYRTSS